MDRAAIHDQDDLAGDVGHQLLAEGDEMTRLETALVQMEAQLAARGYRRHHHDCLALSGSFNDRGLANWRPGCAGVVVGAHSGLICEEDGRAFPGGLGADRRIFLPLPSLNPFGVLLMSALQRPLRGKAKLLQDPPGTHF